MAVVLTNFSPVFTRVPFVTPPDLIRMQTALPRARIDLTVRDGVVPAKPLNDAQNVQVIQVFPTTFAYRLLSATCAIRQDTAAAYDVVSQVQITNALRGHELGLTTRHAMPSGISSSFAPITPERVWFFEWAKPTFVMQSIRVNTGAAIDFRFANTTNPASVAGVLNFYASFYEYDIEQVQLYPALTPANLSYELG